MSKKAKKAVKERQQAVKGGATIIKRPATKKPIPGK
jgi:hypothetical protein